MEPLQSQEETMKNPSFKFHGAKKNQMEHDNDSFLLLNIKEKFNKIRASVKIYCFLWKKQIPV